MNDLLLPPVHLSGKEVPGLAARVLGTALMPWGASGGAAEAIEFAELSGARRLHTLAGQLDSFDPTMWRAPEIVVEREAYALCDAFGGSALFYAAALADWLGAWVDQRGEAVVGLRNVVHVDDLHSVSYWLARSGHAALVLTLAACDDSSAGEQAAVLSASSADRGADGSAGWTHATWIHPDAMPSALLSFASALAHEAPSVPAWTTLQQIGKRWLDGDRRVETGVRSEPPRHCGATAVVVATKRLPDTDLAQRSPARSIDAARFAARRAQAMASGWPIPRQQWEQLMRFADGSLIGTSERSREGAG